MDHLSLSSRMSVPEVMGDPCAGRLRQHAAGILTATAHSKKLIRSHPDIADDIAELQKSVARYAEAVLSKLADDAGIPAEGESVSPATGRTMDYRIDRSSGCWIWMRSVTGGGYPIVGRKAKGRENVPAKIHWMLINGPVGDDEIVVRTCGARLCVNPNHGEVTPRAEYGAARMREKSPLDWDAVREIRTRLCASREGHRQRAAELAARLRISEHSVLEVFRNKVWFDPQYSPGFDVACAGPGCGVVFRTTSATRKYHSKECGAAAIASRSRAKRSRELRTARSPGRRAREDAALRRETATAAAEWSDVAPDAPRTSVWSVASLDQPVGEDGGEFLDVMPAAHAESDPAAELERKAERELLDGLTAKRVESMDEAELAHLRTRLAAADMLPSTSRAV